MLAEDDDQASEYFNLTVETAIQQGALMDAGSSPDIASEETVLAAED